MRETKGVQKVQLELCLVRVQVWDLVNSRLFKLKTQTQLVQKGLQLFSLLNCQLYLNKFLLLYWSSSLKTSNSGSTIVIGASYLFLGDSYF